MDTPEKIRITTNINMLSNNESLNQTVGKPFYHNTQGMISNRTFHMKRSSKVSSPGKDFNWMQSNSSITASQRELLNNNPFVTAYHHGQTSISSLITSPKQRTHHY